MDERNILGVDNEASDLYSKVFASCLEEAADANRIPAAAFENYRVKRGLREQDGTGVMAGVTTIGNVHGYYVYEGEKVADKGKLEYRGFDMAQLVEGYNAENRYGFEEVVYLLLFGKLPTKTELDDFNALLAVSPLGKSSSFSSSSQIISALPSSYLPCVFEERTNALYISPSYSKSKGPPLNSSRSIM